MDNLIFKIFSYRLRFVQLLIDNQSYTYKIAKPYISLNLPPGTTKEHLANCIVFAQVPARIPGLEFKVSIYSSE
jgi:hypothetical protein